MPSYIASKRAGTKDGSTAPGTDNQAAVMVSAPNKDAAKEQAASMLGVDKRLIQVTPLSEAGR